MLTKFVKYLYFEVNPDSNYNLFDALNCHFTEYKFGTYYVCFELNWMTRWCNRRMSDSISNGCVFKSYRKWKIEADHNV